MLTLDIMCQCYINFTKYTFLPVVLVPHAPFIFFKN